MSITKKIFIAATLYDAEGTLVGGDWGSAVTELVDLLGPANVHLSVYENDPDTRAKASLENLAKGISCKPLYHANIQRVLLIASSNRQFLSYIRASST